MSALGQKQTWRRQRTEVRFTPQKGGHKPRRVRLCQKRNVRI